MRRRTPKATPHRRKPKHHNTHKPQKEQKKEKDTAKSTEQKKKKEKGQNKPRKQKNTTKQTENRKFEEEDSKNMEKHGLLLPDKPPKKERVKIIKVVFYERQGLLLPTGKMSRMHTMLPTGKMSRTHIFLPAGKSVQQRQRGIDSKQSGNDSKIICGWVISDKKLKLICETARFQQWRKLLRGMDIQAKARERKARRQQEMATKHKTTRSVDIWPKLMEKEGECKLYLAPTVRQPNFAEALSKFVLEEAQAHDDICQDKQHLQNVDFQVCLKKTLEQRKFSMMPQIVKFNITRKYEVELHCPNLRKFITGAVLKLPKTKKVFLPILNCHLCSWAQLRDRKKGWGMNKEQTTRKAAAKRQQQPTKQENRPKNVSTPKQEKKYLSYLSYHFPSGYLSWVLSAHMGHQLAISEPNWIIDASCCSFCCFSCHIPCLIVPAALIPTVLTAQKSPRTHGIFCQLSSGQKNIFPV